MGRFLLTVWLLLLAAAAVYLQVADGDRQLVALVSWTGGIVVALLLRRP